MTKDPVITDEEYNKIRDEVNQKLDEEIKVAEKEYQYWLSKENPPLWMVFVCPFFSMIVSMALCSFLPENMLNSFNGTFSRSVFYDTSAFLVTLWYLLYLREKNGANYSALQNAESVVLMNSRYFLYQKICTLDSRLQTLEQQKRLLEKELKSN